jgi:cyclophilin family peptidyl-prolyl cis-trans isomerase
MAKGPTDPAGTAGSQFFVVTADALLPPDYAVIGRVTDGLDTIDRIEALGDAQTELPRRPVAVDRMTVEEG